MSKKAFEEKLAKLETLESAAELRKALGDRNNYYVGKAAKRASLLGLRELVPELVAAFDRFMEADPQCWAKKAIAEALKDFGHDDASFFIRGMQHIQLEPVWGGTADAAGGLRGVCVLSLPTCSIPRSEAMKHLVDRLADSDKTVKVEAARAIAQLGGVEALLLLRLKALAGDEDVEVTGQCLSGLLALSAEEYVPFAAKFLEREDEARFEAAAALADCSELAAIQTLTAHFGVTRDSELRRAILLALGAARLECAAEFLVSVVAGRDVEEGSLAIRALGASRFREGFRDRIATLVRDRGEAKLESAFAREFRD